MTPQEIFDKVATHLFTQGVQSRNKNGGTCLYRGPNNTSCAVGCLIPDELYDPEMDGFYDGEKFIYSGHSVQFILRKHTLPSYFLENKGLLNYLQEVHDFDVNWETTRNMRSALEKLAKNCVLDPSILKALKFGRRK